MCSHHSLQLTPDELNQLKLLTQAYRTKHPIARRARLIQLSHAQAFLEHQADSPRTESS